jgi:hypothetical protein
MNTTQARDVARSFLGAYGRILAGSKELYEQTNPAAIALFNASLRTDEYGTIWFGDLDLSLDTDRKNLQGIANTLNCKVYVMRSLDRPPVGYYEPQETAYVTLGLSAVEFQNLVNMLKDYRERSTLTLSEIALIEKVMEVSRQKLQETSTRIQAYETTD